MAVARPVTRRRWAWLPALALLAACVDASPPPAREEEAPPRVADAVRAVTWSPDGRNLLASWYRRDRHRLYVIFGPSGPGAPSAPSRGIPMTEDEALNGDWSPDRLWVAFETSRDGNAEIYRARPDGMAPENLTADPSDDGSPAYSPDGRRIAFTSTRGGGSPAVWIMRSDGRDPHPLDAPVPPGAQRRPTWSPDGGRLAFSVRDGGSDQVYVTAADGSAASALAQGGRPAWSRDGRRLYYARRDTIFVRPSDGADNEEFVALGTAPAPSPDGLWLAFVRGDTLSASLYLMELASRVETRITP